MNRQNKNEPIAEGGVAILDAQPEAWKIHLPGRVYCVLAVVEQDEDGKLFSYSPSLPGAASQGDTAEEALENLKDALADCIRSYRDGGEEIPWVEYTETPKEAMIARWIDVNV